MEKTTSEIIVESVKRTQERRAARPRVAAPLARAARPATLSTASVNVPAMLASMHLVTAEISALKKTMRASGHMIAWKEARELAQLKREATSLCVLSARLRGRLHLPVTACSVEQQNVVAFETAAALPQIAKEVAA